MSVTTDVVVAVLLAGCAGNVILQYPRLARHRRTQFVRLLTAPGGWRVRLWLLVGTGGLLDLATGSAVWPYLAGLWFAIAGWEATVQATAWIRRVRQRRAAS